MQIVVLGAGVIGVTTAYQLLKDGHEVTVIDRAPGPASFTSFANAGLVAPGHAYAWASPAAPKLMLRSLLGGDQAIKFKPRASREQWRWVKQFLRQCNGKRARVNSQRKARLCLYSQERLREVVAETGLRYDGRDGGLLYFYRTQQAFEKAAAKADILRGEGVELIELDRSETIAKDPGLALAARQIAGALYAPGDESGDANLFTIALAETCKAMGAEFRYGETVEKLETTGSLIEAVVTNRERLMPDAVILCLGVMSPALVKELGIDLPIYPVKGYSATFDIIDRAQAPRIGGVDEENLLAYCPMGDRLRVTATAEISDFDNTARKPDFRVMMKRARGLFDHAADFGTPTLWAGLRPMTPTGLPIIDRSPVENMWLNTGHGHMGWTMACGSARILADLVAQRRPAVDLEGIRYDE